VKYGKSYWFYHISDTNCNKFKQFFGTFLVIIDLIDLKIMGLGPKIIKIGPEMPILELCLTNPLFITKFQFRYGVKMGILTIFRNERCAVPKWPQNSKNRHSTISMYVWESPWSPSVGWLDFWNIRAQWPGLPVITLSAIQGVPSSPVNTWTEEFFKGGLKTV